MRFYQKYYPGNYEELITYYPKFYRDVLEMRAILEAHGAVLDELEDNIELVFFNNFIDTADEQTIADLERFLGIKLNRSRSLEVRRRFVKSFFVGFGKVSASILEAIISSYTHDTVRSRFEPFDSAGNNMLHLEYRRGDVPTLYLEDITYLISKKMPAHILWHAMLTYHVEVGIRAARHHYVIDYDLTGTKPEISTLGGYSAAASVVRARKTNGLTNFPAAEEAGIQSGQYPRSTLLVSIAQSASVTRAEEQSHTIDHHPAEADGYAGLFPENAVLGTIQKMPLGTKPDMENYTLDHETSGVLPEAAWNGHVVRQTSVTLPEAENGIVGFESSGTLPDHAFSGHIVHQENAAKAKIQNVHVEHESSSSDGSQITGALPSPSAAGHMVVSESGVKTAIENIGVDYSGASEDRTAGAGPDTAGIAGTMGANAGAKVKAESFSVEYRYCGTDFAGN